VCELTWCIALHECHGAPALGVDLVQLERAMDDGTWHEYTAQKKDRGWRELVNILCDTP
jgi:hypothetical protein